MLTFRAACAGATENREDLTLLLRAWSHGDRDALERLTPVIYRELRALTRSKLDR